MICTDEDGAAVVSAQVTRKTPLVGSDHLQDLASLADPHDLITERVGNPYGALGVQTDAVGHDRTERSPFVATVESPVLVAGK